MTKIELSATVALLVGYGLLMLAMFLAAFGRAFRKRKQETRSAAIQPEIRDALVDYLSGNNDLTRLRAFAQNHRRDVIDAILVFQGALTGSALSPVPEA